MVLSSALAGAAAKATRDVLLHPIDTIKSRQQVGAGASLAGLYAGVVPTVLFAAPAGAVYFSVDAEVIDAL